MRGCLRRDGEEVTRPGSVWHREIRQRTVSSCGHAWRRIRLPRRARRHGWDPVAVEYEVAHDESLRQVVAHGTAAATRELAHSVHPEIHGLEPLAGTSTDSVRGRRSPRWAGPALG